MHKWTVLMQMVRPGQSVYCATTVTQVENSDGRDSIILISQWFTIRLFRSGKFEPTRKVDDLWTHILILV